MPSDPNETTAVGALYSYQAALSYSRRNPSTTKKDLFLLYLLAHKVIGKYQIAGLLSYPAPIPHSAEVFINRMCLGGFCTKMRNQNGRDGMDFFLLAPAGLPAAIDAYRSGLTQCLQSDSSVATSLLPFAMNGILPIDEWAGWLSENFTARVHNQPKGALLLHMSAVEDCFLTLLRHMDISHFYMPPQYEVPFQYGRTIPLDSQLSRHKPYSSSLLRCDAAYYIHHESGNDSTLQTVIVEQDTHSQRFPVLKSKIRRYFELLQEWLDVPNQLPPFLIFSLFTASGRQELPHAIHNAKARQLSILLGMVADMCAEAEAENPHDITVRQVAEYLGTFRGDYIEECCRQIAALPIQCLDTPAYSFMEHFPATSTGNAYALFSRYTARRESIFSLCQELPSCASFFFRGFSLSTLQNDTPSHLLSFFPYESGFSSRLASDLHEVTGGTPTQILRYEAVHDFDGISMRNCFFMGDGSCYAVEQVGDDLGGRMRSERYLKGKGYPFSLIMVLSQKDAYALLPHFLKLMGDADTPVYCTLFSPHPDGIAYSHLARLDQFQPE